MRRTRFVGLVVLASLAHVACAPRPGPAQPACAPGELRCSPSGSDIEVCEGAGVWRRAATCVAGACVVEGGDAECSPSDCSPGETRCLVDGTTSGCVAGGWSPSEPCPSGETCDPLGSWCVEMVCGPNTLFCWGQEQTRRCDALGASSTLVETCTYGAVCSGGECYSRCVFADLKRDTAGCAFYGLDTNNAEHDDPLGYEISVWNPDPELSAAVVVETREPSTGAWVTLDGDTLGPEGFRTFLLPDRHAEGSVLTAGLAYRVSSSLPVRAFQLNSNGVDGVAASSGATLLIARSGLLDSHYVMSLPSSMSNDALFDFGNEMHSSGFSVVGAWDGTTVTVISATFTQPGAGIPALAPGESYATVLNEGDVLQIEALGLGDDVSGTAVLSDLPVAVFGHHECATLTPGTCDHVEEQLLGEGYWGYDYPLAAAGAPGPRLWRFMAGSEETFLSFTAEPGVMGLPAPEDPAGRAPFVHVAPGEVVDLIVSGDFHAYGSSEFFVAQFTLDEPSMLTGVPLDRWSPDVRFVAPTEFTTSVTVLRSTSADLIFDGASSPALLWSPIDTWVEAARTDVLPGAHRLEGEAEAEYDMVVEAYVSGIAGSASWGFAAHVERFHYGGRTL